MKTCGKNYLHEVKNWEGIEGLNFWFMMIVSASLVILYVDLFFKFFCALKQFLLYYH